MSADRYQTPLPELMLGAFITSPLFRALSGALPPRRGGGRPADVSPAVALFVGAVVVAYRSTRRADTALQMYWLRFHRLLHTAGYEVGLNPPRSQHWHDYRAEYLEDPELIEVMLGRWRKVAAVMANDMGLGLPAGGPLDYLNLIAEEVLFGDGMWARPASEIGYGKPLRASRAKREPRIVTDAIRHGKKSRTFGYPLTSIGIRGPKKRQRIILDLSIAPGGSPAHEITEVIDRLELVLPHFAEDAIRGFVYDGAMNSKHHRKIRTKFGLLSVNRRVGHNKAKTMREELAERLGLHRHHWEKRTFPRDWVRLVWRRPAPRPQHWALTVDDCTHRVGFTWGALWTVEDEYPNVEGVDPELANVRYRWGRPCRVTGIRRYPDGRKYRWEVDVKIPCQFGPHVITFDPNRDRLNYQMKRSSSAKGTELNLFDPDSTVNQDAKGRKINLAQQFGIIDQTRTHRFARMYGIRNDAESWNSTLQGFYMIGKRSRTFSRERFLLDVLLATTMHNTLNWEEHSTSRARQARAA